MYNPDVERLAGELTAESLDRQIRGGGTDTDVRAAQLRAGMQGAAGSGGGQRLGAAAGAHDASEPQSEADLEAEEERYGVCCCSAGRAVTRVQQHASSNNCLCRLLQAAIDASMQDVQGERGTGGGNGHRGALAYQRQARQRYLHSKKRRGRK